MAQATSYRIRRIDGAEEPGWLLRKISRISSDRKCLVRYNRVKLVVLHPSLHHRFVIELKMVVDVDTQVSEASQYPSSESKVLNLNQHSIQSFTYFLVIESRSLVKF